MTITLNEVEKIDYDELKKKSELEKFDGLREQIEILKEELAKLIRQILDSDGYRIKVMDLRNP